MKRDAARGQRLKSLQIAPKNLQNCSFPPHGGEPTPVPPYTFGSFLLDPSERRLLRDGRPIALTPKAFDLLNILVEHSGHLVTKEHLLQTLWPRTFVEESNLNRCVSVLRKALGDDGNGQRYIETVPKRGYRFIAPVAQAVSVAPAVAADVADVTTDAALSTLSASRRPRLKRSAIAFAAVLTFVALASVLTLRLDLASDVPVVAVHRQATFAGHEGSPALSPDGRRIAYVSAASGVHHIVVQELESGQQVTIATAAEAGGLRWSPDGSELLVFTRNPGDPGGLFIISRADGIARPIARGQFVASWSPDGQRIAIGQYLIGRVLLVDQAGRPRGSFAVAGAQRWIADVDWSSVTNRLLVVGRDSAGHHTIWTIDPDGTDQQTVISESAEITAARWAPEGDAIYYFRRDGQTVTLSKVAASGRAAGTALLTGIEADGSFAVSADGRQLVYARAPFYSNLYVVNTSLAPGSSAPLTRRLTQGTSLVERPSISPDGSRVLFNVGHEGSANLYTLPITGGDPTPVTFFKSFNVAGAWSRDGTSIAFASTEGGKARVWMMSAAGGAPHPVSTGEFSETFDVQWSAANEVLYQQTGNRNYYVLDPATGRERSLMSDASIGWVFSPVYSPDGTKVVFGWSRKADYGLWIRNTRDSSERLVYGASIPTVIGWSADGTSFYAYEGERAAYRGLSTPSGETSTKVKILKVTDSGAASIVVTLPFEEVGGIAMTPDGSALICSVYSSRSDVWIVDHFDNTGPNR
jgi:Tol biopolymer transport system component/DNA-binding winged helix-turn-helix (wHTH) protein